jgi:hypothetical protein
VCARARVSACVRVCACKHACVEPNLHANFAQVRILHFVLVLLHCVAIFLAFLLNETKFLLFFCSCHYISLKII